MVELACLSCPLSFFDKLDLLSHRPFSISSALLAAIGLLAGIWVRFCGSRGRKGSPFSVVRRAEWIFLFFLLARKRTGRARILADSGFAFVSKTGHGHGHRTWANAAPSVGCAVAWKKSFSPVRRP
jgi:hypothetical protein